MNLKHWFREHALKLVAIRDHPGAVAGGVAIGIFFGFTPLVGLKTVSSIFFAWVTRSNVIAAAVACTAHDLFLPLMPLIYRFEYRVGYWILSVPHHWPLALRKLDWSGHSWHDWNWHTFLTVGRPLLLGSMTLAGPSALVSFAITKVWLERHQKKHAVIQHFPPGPPPLPGS